jgi:hypothetical protein
MDKLKSTLGWLSLQWKQENKNRKPREKWVKGVEILTDNWIKWKVSVSNNDTNKDYKELIDLFVTHLQSIKPGTTDMQETEEILTSILTTIINDLKKSQKQPHLELKITDTNTQIEAIKKRLQKNIEAQKNVEILMDLLSAMFDFYKTTDQKFNQDIHKQWKEILKLLNTNTTYPDIRSMFDQKDSLTRITDILNNIEGMNKHVKSIVMIIVFALIAKGLYNHIPKDNNGEPLQNHIEKNKQKKPWGKNEMTIDYPKKPWEYYESHNWQTNGWEEWQRTTDDWKHKKVPNKTFIKQWPWIITKKNDTKDQASLLGALSDNNTTINTGENTIHIKKGQRLKSCIAWKLKECYLYWDDEIKYDDVESISQRIKHKEKTNDGIKFTLKGTWVKK